MSMKRWATDVFRSMGDILYREGYLVATDEPAEIFYDGRQLPDPEYDITSPLILSVTKNRKEHDIYLPAPEVNMKFWKERLGIDNLDEFRDFEVKDSMDGLKERLPWRQFPGGTKPSRWQTKNRTDKR